MSGLHAQYPVTKENGHGVEPLANRLRMVELHAKVHERMKKFVIKGPWGAFVDTGREQTRLNAFFFNSTI